MVFTRGNVGSVWCGEWGVFETVCFVAVVRQAPVANPCLFLQPARAIEMSAAGWQQCLWCLFSLLAGAGAGRECVSGGVVWFCPCWGPCVALQGCAVWGLLNPALVWKGQIATIRTVHGHARGV